MFCGQTLKKNTYGIMSILGFIIHKQGQKRLYPTEIGNLSIFKRLLTGFVSFKCQLHNLIDFKGRVLIKIMTQLIYYLTVDLTCKVILKFR
jgi:hypothetical protein